MIDFRVSEHPDIITEISSEALLCMFEKKVNLDLIRFMIENQDKVEVTYHKHEDRYRFDNVCIGELVLKFKPTDKVFAFIERDADSYRANIDVDLKNNRVVFLNLIEGIGEILNLDIPEPLKIEQINIFKEMQKDIRNLGFKLEEIDDLSYLSLVCYNPISVNLNDLAKAFYITERYFSHKADTIGCL